MNVRLGPLAEHVVWFVLLVLLVSVVYNGLRRENVGEIVRVGIRRGIVFALLSLLVFGVGGYLLAKWL
ncbi:MAG: hypothetical protein FJ293_15140 [Planctomycetes bacterium]|nr:hypothetical protein [Planctomycetota bacterium]